MTLREKAEAIIANRAHESSAHRDGEITCVIAGYRQALADVMEKAWLAQVDELDGQALPYEMVFISELERIAAELLGEEKK